MAPTMFQIEEEYKDKVNFVLVNGDKRDAWPLIEAFGVDGLPHIALVSSEGDVETALIGPIPKHILEDDLNGTCDPGISFASISFVWRLTHRAHLHFSVLISNAKRNAAQSQPIPYRMLDVFAGRPDARRVHFDP